MAPKPPTLMEKKDPPVSTDSIEEEDDDEVSSSSEEEQEKTAKPSSSLPLPKQSATTTTSTPQPQSSDSESEESDSEESEPEKTHRPTSAPDPNVKPIASKPMEETTKTTKPRSKMAATPSKSSPKRAIENDSHRKDPKKAKRDSDSGSGHDPEQLSVADPKKLLFQRLWSEDDEIAVLKGMVEYSRKKGADPMTDVNQFLEYIKNSLHFDVTKPQLHDKIRRLKKKYENNLGRGKKGKEPTFSKPHEQKAYEISKKVWGSEAAELSAAPMLKAKTRANSKASAPEGKKMKIDEIKNSGLEGMDEYVVKYGLEFVDGSKKVELEERWRKFQLAQLELFVERSELVFDQAKLMLEAMKSSNQ